MPAKKKTSGTKRAKSKAAPLPPAPIVAEQLETYAEQAYLDYSMYVVRHRALPAITDGLKPVQRRIIYAMHELGLHHGSKPKKSARAVGDVLGKFHPHGDTACYEAMVLMAQPFSIRHPLIEGQGNWGSIDDPKSFAAMRYTEARLTKYASVLLSEIGQGTVDTQDNFDGSLREPVCLPAGLPNILLNGSSGIAVGLATDIPPHNIREVAAACALMLKRKRVSLNDLLKLLPAPDFPGGCQIVASPEELSELYRSGTANLRLRAVYHPEGRSIVFTRLPHQVSIAQIIAQLHKLREAKKLPMVRQWRDESDEESEIRLVVKLASGREWDVEECARHLLAATDLECGYRAQMNVLTLAGRPEMIGLVELLSQWLEWRTGIVRRRIEWLLGRNQEQARRIEALLQVFADLDRIIAIIRNSDDPKTALQEEFGFSDYVVEVILETKLRQLARLEELSLREQLKKLRLEERALNSYLDDPKRLQGLVRQEIERLGKEFEEERRSEIVEGEAATAMDVREKAPVLPLAVMLTSHGWVRAARAGELDPGSASLRAGDSWVSFIEARSDQWGYCFDEKGRVFRLRLADLPTSRGQGEPVSKHCRCPAGALWAGMVGQDSPRVALCGSGGYGFICQTAKFDKIGSQGRQLAKIAEGERLLKPQPLGAEKNADAAYLALLTSESLLVIVSIDEIPERGSGRGVRLVQLASKGAKKSATATAAIVVSCTLLRVGDKLTLRDGAGKTKSLSPDDWEKYIKGRGRRGLLARVFRKSMAIGFAEPQKDGSLGLNLDADESGAA